ncbi:hypothetical protein GV828_09145 [Flavobacterium sp. NST-5]|uniref:Beta-carotene 15,15'-monooxygenase n=1 Tax=Flavobacterium ichthyis TaxID=2698827 RepID=A0ABW9Z8Y5_9FLAO|nr:hypothetical protein [Flavobacterium ichthyis]NBL65361.1 hypothetical protein [Flavobacterium ichthyis]
MEELDLLKKDWKRSEGNFRQISELDIYKMIHKSSSSVVKWILVISMIEFVVLTVLGLVVSDENYVQRLEMMHILTVMNVLTYLNYAVVIGFIYFFYKNFRAISVTDSAKNLMKSILKSRKTVQYYIYYNLTMFVFIFALVLVCSCMYDPKMIETFNQISQHDNSTLIWIVTAVLFIVMFAAMFGLFWLFYRLVYGFLLRKLYKNYQELKKIEL